jgi:hypothetical protein
MSAKVTVRNDCEDDYEICEAVEGVEQHLKQESKKGQIGTTRTGTRNSSWPWLPTLSTSRETCFRGRGSFFVAQLAKWGEVVVRRKTMM